MLGLTLAVGLSVAGCQSTQDASDPGSAAAPGGVAVTGTAYPQEAEPTTATGEVREVTDEQVHQALLAMDDALQAGDVEAFLTHVHPDLHEEQRAWFQGVSVAPLDVRQLRLDGVVSRAPGGTIAHVGLRHQFTGADPVPVLQQYRWVFTTSDDATPVLTETGGRTGDFFGHPQLWDTGEELSVLQGHQVSVLVARSRTSEAETILDTLDRAAETTLAELPWLAEDRERLVVQLAPADVIEEHGFAMSTGSSLQLRVSPEEPPREPSRLSTMSTPVRPHLFLDLELALLDLEDFGSSPGGQTELRYVAAYGVTWGEDPAAWPVDWILQGPAYWWSSVDDPQYAFNMLHSAGDHFAAVGPPTQLPSLEFDPGDPAAADVYMLESLALSYYLEQTYGRETFVRLVDRLIHLDQRFDADEIEQVHQEELGTDQDGLLEGYAAWTQTLPTFEDEPGPPPLGR